MSISSQRVAHRVDDARMTVPEVEDPAVAVAVPVPAAAVGVLEARALAAAQDERHAERRERLHLAAVDVRERALRAGERRRWGGRPGAPRCSRVKYPATARATSGGHAATSGGPTGTSVRAPSRPARGPSLLGQSMTQPATTHHLPVDRRISLMGTDVRIVVGPPARPGLDPPGAAADAVESLLRRYDATLSRFRPDSELSLLNADPREVVPASPLLRSALRRGARGGGAHRRARRSGAARRHRGRGLPVELRAAPPAGPARRARRGRRDAARRPARPALSLAPDRRRRRRRARVRRPPGLRIDTGGTGMRPRRRPRRRPARRLRPLGRSTAAATCASAARRRPCGPSRSSTRSPVCAGDGAAPRERRGGDVGPARTDLARPDR